MTIGLALISLSGCGDLFEPTISEICESHSEICLDLSLDARCRVERAEIIRLRYYNQDTKDDAYKYPLLLNFEKYLTCVEEVQHIEHVKRKGKEATRLKGVITAQREIKRLSRETKDSLDPYLSYYHWTRFNDKDAFHRFERYAASNRVTDPSLLVSLASVQIKTDLKRTTETLHRALSLYTDSDDIDVSVFYSLAAIGMDLENYRRAYVWYGVAEAFDDRLGENQRVQLGEMHDLPTEILDDIVDEIISNLKSVTFDANALKLDKL
ncbi:hypothetical protein KUL156_04720 [Alteromonas sp. KUL156]|nr:hypothetical protein KUL118_53140 [Tenacibaculum sp. KUL118]GFD91813.1 hypothetical protein KUL154_05460 [Alteromonas sp. KUL154]GFD97879.1 hypothetical protein KUL156_04720 [Alteromonas sp. KUL156]